MEIENIIHQLTIRCMVAGMHPSPMKSTDESIKSVFYESGLRELLASAEIAAPHLDSLQIALNNLTNWTEKSSKITGERR